MTERCHSSDTHTAVDTVLMLVCLVLRGRTRAKLKLCEKGQEVMYINAHFSDIFDILPFSILTATVLQVESLSIPKADASTTFPKAPWPRVLPGKGRRYLISGTTSELPVPQGGKSDWIPCQSGNNGSIIKTTCWSSDLQAVVSRKHTVHWRLDDSTGHW